MLQSRHDGVLDAAPALSSFRMPSLAAIGGEERAMSSRNQMRAVGFTAGVLCALAGVRTASAAPCESLPKPVYVTGSSAVKPFLKGLGKALSESASPVTIVYKGQGSCTGVDAILESVPMTGTASYWDASGAETSCDLALAGNRADIGVSDVFPTSCPNVTETPANVGDFFGPVQVMEMVVPVASSQSAISAEAAYLLWGFGAGGEVGAWTDETQMIRRNEQSGTQTMIGLAIGVPANRWKGIDAGGSSGVLTQVSSSAEPEKTIGILAADVADANRAALKVLAFQAYGQKCGYWPDSSPTSFDKKNVRDGHYPIWGPLHLLANVDGSGKPVKKEAADIIGYFTGDVKPPATVNLLDLQIAANTVPICAMNVERTSEMGDVRAYTPAEPCGCYFDFKTTGTTSCQACAADSDCTGSNKHCRYGYCEAN